MVQSKVLKQLSILEQRKFDDEDIVEDIQFLNERLQASVQDLRYKFVCMGVTEFKKILLLLIDILFFFFIL